MSLSISQLTAANHIHRSSLPRWAHYAARGAIQALQADGIERVDDPVEAIHQLEPPLKDAVPALRRLLALPMVPDDVAGRILAGEPTLADAIACVELQPWAERSRVRGACRKLAQSLNTPPAGIPATVRHLEATLERVTAAELSLSRAAIGNFRSRVLRAARLVDLAETQVLKTASLPPAWRRLVEDAKTRRLNGDIAKIWPLIAHCVRRSVDPAGVDDATVAGLRSHLTERGRADPFELARAAVYAWERLQARVPGWPEQRLARLYARPRTDRFEQLPMSVQALWTGFAEATRRRGGAEIRPEELVVGGGVFDDLLAGESNGDPGGRYQPETLRNMRTIFTQAAHLLLSQGRPVARLGDLASPAVAAALVEAAHRRRRGNQPFEKFARGKSIASTLRTFGAYDGCPEADLETMLQIQWRADPNVVEIKRDLKTGKPKPRYREDRIGERHRTRLHQFTDPRVLGAWLMLPERLEAMVRATDPQALDLEACNLVQVAVIHRIARCTPLRRANLGELRVSGSAQNLFVPTNGRSEGRIEIDWFEAKNKKDHHVLLGRTAVATLRWWIDHVRPRQMALLGVASDNPYLFPGETQTGHRWLEQLNDVFVAVNKRHGGFTLNLHVLRHLAAKLYLDFDPGGIGTVQVLLNHKSVMTTQRYYAELNTILAQRRFQELLAEAERAALLERRLR